MAPNPGGAGVAVGQRWCGKVGAGGVSGGEVGGTVAGMACGWGAGLVKSTATVAPTLGAGKSGLDVPVPACQDSVLPIPSRASQ